MATEVMKQWLASLVSKLRHFRTDADLNDELKTHLELQEEDYVGENGRLIGTYLHHLFHNDEWRNDWLNRLREQKGITVRTVVNVGRVKDERYNELANGILPHLDWKRLKEIILTGA